MNFDRKSKELYGEKCDWLDCRMIAFKHNLMDNRILYLDIVNSTKMDTTQFRKIHNMLIEYMHNLPKRHPEDISDFLVTENIKNYKKYYEEYKYYYVLGGDTGVGDELMLGITPNANVQKIVDEISNEVLNGEVARCAIGYYAGNNEFWTPDYDMYVLNNIKYFKNQLILGEINDTRPSKEQIDKYYKENFEYVNRMESIHRKDIYKGEER